MGNVCAVYGGACPLGRLVAVKLILVFLLCLVGSMVIWLAKKKPFDRRWLDFDGLSSATLRLYDVLATVSYGQCVTYGMVAARMASSPRAVGQLLCRNRFALVIPCHRVVGATSLKGYGGKDGGKRKKALLDWEGAHMPF